MSEYIKKILNYNGLTSNFIYLLFVLFLILHQSFVFVTQTYSHTFYVITYAINLLVYKYDIFLFLTILYGIVYLMYKLKWSLSFDLQTKIVLNNSVGIKYNHNIRTLLVKLSKYLLDVFTGFFRVWFILNVIIQLPLKCFCPYLFTGNLFTKLNHIILLIYLIINVIIACYSLVFKLSSNPELISKINYFELITLYKLICKGNYKNNDYEILIVKPIIFNKSFNKSYFFVLKSNFNRNSKDPSKIIDNMYNNLSSKILKSDINKINEDTSIHNFENNISIIKHKISKRGHSNEEERKALKKDKENIKHIKHIKKDIRNNAKNISILIDKTNNKEKSYTYSILFKSPSFQACKCYFDNNVSKI